jgi:thioredoxin
MDEKTFTQTISAGSRPVLVEFWAPWCVPCRSMAPTLERLATQYNEQVDLLKLNADENSQLIHSLKIFGIPTVIGFSQGIEQFRRTGAQSEPALTALFQALAHQQPPPPPRLLPSERLLRLSAGAVFFGMGLALNTWLLTVVGAFVLFSGVYDRCPIYRAISSVFKDRLTDKPANPS